MKRVLRIAPLLIVIALGIERISGAQAFISQDDSAVSVNKKTKDSEFKGIRIDPKPLDLLWQDKYNSKPKKSPDRKAVYSQNYQLLEKEMISETRNNGKPDYLQPDLLQNYRRTEISKSQKQLKQ